MSTVPNAACKTCGYVNAYGVTACARCGTLLFVIGDTHTFDKPAERGTDEHPTPLWGSARFVRTFTVHIDDKPVATAVIGKNAIIIGRADANYVPDIDLAPYSAQELGVSRRHLEIRKVADGLAARDSSSANGTILNGDTVMEHGRWYPIIDGVEIKLAKLVIRGYFS